MFVSSPAALIVLLALSSCGLARAQVSVERKFACRVSLSWSPPYC